MGGIFNLNPVALNKRKIVSRAEYNSEMDRRDKSREEFRKECIERNTIKSGPQKGLVRCFSFMQDFTHVTGMDMQIIDNPLLRQIARVARWIRVY